MNWIENNKTLTLNAPIWEFSIREKGIMFELYANDKFIEENSDKEWLKFQAETILLRTNKELTNFIKNRGY